MQLILYTLFGRTIESMKAEEYFVLIETAPPYTAEFEGNAPSGSLELTCGTIIVENCEHTIGPQSFRCTATP